MVAKESIQNYSSKTPLVRIFFFNEKQEFPVQNGNMGSPECTTFHGHTKSTDNIGQFTLEKTLKTS